MLLKDQLTVDSDVLVRWKPCLHSFVLVKQTTLGRNYTPKILNLLCDRDKAQLNRVMRKFTLALLPPNSILALASLHEVLAHLSFARLMRSHGGLLALDEVILNTVLTELFDELCKLLLSLDILFHFLNVSVVLHLLVLNFHE